MLMTHKHSCSGISLVLSTSLSSFIKISKALQPVFCRAPLVCTFVLYVAAAKVKFTGFKKIICVDTVMIVTEVLKHMKKP